MSIASEISRLQSDSFAIATAIAAKGVTVPSGSGFDDYATLIGNIQTGGGSANLTSLSVTPSTSAQQITPTSPVDGYDEVNVSAVTSSIDSNIVAGNIKSGVSILGVTGTYGGGSSLPYTPLEYIETDGVAYINSGVAVKATMSFDLKVKMNASISSMEIFVGTGATDGNAGTLNGLWRSTANQSKIGYGYYYMYSSILTPSGFSNPFEVSTRLLKGTCAMGIKESGSSSYTGATANRTNNVTASQSLYIFASNVSGSASYKASSGSRIYYIRIISGGSFPNLAFDGFPALYNGEYGLWDNVTNSFFGNAASSGSFTGA